ncbi:MAG: hypothetical protein ACR2HG_13845 [Pyrinomonadaceae bacterium]
MSERGRLVRPFERSKNGKCLVFIQVWEIAVCAVFRFAQTAGGRAVRAPTVK